MSNVRRFEAKYYGECSECFERIEPGDDAGFLDGTDGICCDSCVEMADEGDDW